MLNGFKFDKDTLHTDQNGMTTISYILATALSLVVISWAVVFVLFSYTRAAVRGASERGTRAGVVEYSVSRDATRAVNACNTAFRADINQAIKGEVASTLNARCEIQGDEMHVISTSSVRSLSALFPNMIINEDTFRTFEKIPTP